MPSLLEAHKISSRAAQIGFDWPNMEGLFDKVAEETPNFASTCRNFPLPDRARKAGAWPVRGGRPFRKICECGSKKRWAIFFCAGQYRTLPGD